MKRKILYISMCLPFDKAFHAGGKTFNYYINSFANDSDNEVTLIAKVLPDEERYVDTVNKNIRFYSVSAPKFGFKKYYSYLKSLNSKLNPVYKYGNTLTRDIYYQIEEKMKALQVDGYAPDIVILEWTSMLLFVERVKKYFPLAKIVASEHDVTFLGKKRKYETSKGMLKKELNYVRYSNIKKRELAAIHQCDLVVTHNEKDRQLLIANSVLKEKLGVIAPYYDSFPSTKRTSQKGNIIYYGAMNRIENSSSALWFIENVMPRLKDEDVKFTIIGNKPPQELVNKRSEKIVITGFVDDPAPYFENAMCLVAPLLLGAGVKVKIIEALSSGVPVITNDIGIEGIDANDGVEYLHATEPIDYENIIRKMILGEIDTNAISSNAINLIRENYNLSKSFAQYSRRVYALLKNGG